MRIHNNCSKFGLVLRETQLMGFSSSEQDSCRAPSVKDGFTVSFPEEVLLVDATSDDALHGFVRFVHDELQAVSCLFPEGHLVKNDCN